MKDKRFVGIPTAILFAGFFVGISLLGLRILQGTAWYLFSSALRLGFGILILRAAKRLYGTTTGEIFSFQNSRAALIAGAGFLLYFGYFTVDLFSGIQAISGLTVGLFLSRIIFQQITTGFYEELNYRFLIGQGYFHGKRTAVRRLLYGFLSFVLFGLVHVIDGWDTDRFFLTGTIGFAFAVMYLRSGNLLIPMLLHAVYDAFANLSSFFVWKQSAWFTAVNALFDVMTIIMFAVSLVLLMVRRLPLCGKDEGNPEEEPEGTDTLIPREG